MSGCSDQNDVPGGATASTAMKQRGSAAHELSEAWCDIYMSQRHVSLSCSMERREMSKGSSLAKQGLPLNGEAESKATWLTNLSLLEGGINTRRQRAAESLILPEEARRSYQKAVRSTTPFCNFYY